MTYLLFYGAVFATLVFYYALAWLLDLMGIVKKD